MAVVSCRTSKGRGTGRLRCQNRQEARKTYEARNPCCSSKMRWTSWRGLFCSLYSEMMTSLYMSHGFVMVAVEIGVKGIINNNNNNNNNKSV